ncbi:hypothetical protein ACJJTC_016503 [Scirpophaga incertulas]
MRTVLTQQEERGEVSGEAGEASHSSEVHSFNYLVKRLESLEAQWNDFQIRHQILMETMEDKNINYFKEDVYGSLKELYDSTVANMKDLLQRLRGKKSVFFDMSGMLEDNANQSLTALMERQQCNFKALDRVMSKIDINTVTESWVYSPLSRPRTQ